MFGNDDEWEGGAPMPMENQIRHHLDNLKSVTVGRDPTRNTRIFAEIPDWQLRQWLDEILTKEKS
ncbi:MAG: hypothetical protein V3T23_01870 [Nitrososphaerales archaeon]